MQFLKISILRGSAATQRCVLFVTCRRSRRHTAVRQRCQWERSLTRCLTIHPCLEWRCSVTPVSCRSVSRGVYLRRSVAHATSQTVCDRRTCDSRLRSFVNRAPRRLCSTGRTLRTDHRYTGSFTVPFLTPAPSYSSPAGFVSPKHNSVAKRTDHTALKNSRMGFLRHNS